MPSQESSPNTISLTVNGQVRSMAQGSKVADLLAELGVPTAGTAVELAGEVLSAKSFDTPLADGQRIEIVRMVGGG